MQKPLFAALLPLLLVLAACSSSGPKIETARLTELRKGETTAAEIFKEFGRPNFLSKNIDGSQMAVYVRSDSGGPLSSGSESVTFNFTPAGVLSDYKYSPPMAPRGTPAPAASEPPARVQSPTGATTATTAAPTPAANPPVPAAAASGGSKSNVPYLWDILRDSAPSDPRRR